MSNSLNAALYVVVAFGCAYLGTNLRKKVDQRTKERLIQQSEAILNMPLPKHKKGELAEQIKWDWVYNSLKKQPEDKKITKLLKRIDVQIKLEEKNKARFKPRK